MLRASRPWKALPHLQRAFGGVCRYVPGSFERAFPDSPSLKSHYASGRFTMLYDELVKLKTDTEDHQPQYPAILNA